MTADTLLLTENMFAKLREQATDKARAKKAAAFVETFEKGSVADLLEQYASKAGALLLDEARNELADECAKKTLTKPLLALYNTASQLGVVLAVKVLETDPETGEATKACLAPVETKAATARGARKAADSFTLDGKTYTREGSQLPYAEAFKAVSPSSKLHGAAQLVLSATGAGNAHKVYKALGWTTSRGTLPSEKTSYNAYQALKYMVMHGAGAEREALKALKAAFVWGD